MKIENRTLYECPLKSCIQIPDMSGLFLVQEFLDDRVICTPLRGKFHGMLFRTANLNLLEVSLTLDAQVRLVWFESEAEIDVCDLFGVVDESYL